jgi:hypothetical protein
MQRHRSFGSEQAEIVDRDPCRRLVGRLAEIHHVLHGEGQPHILAEPCRFAVRPAGMAEQAALPFQPAQQFEEVETFGQGSGSL